MLGYALKKYVAQFFNLKIRYAITKIILKKIEKRETMNYWQYR